MARRESAERASEKAGGFATAKKNVTIQYGGRERDLSNIITLIRKDAIANGANDEDIDQVDIYVKPQEQSIYYVVNKEMNGRIDF